MATENHSSEAKPPGICEALVSAFVEIIPCKAPATHIVPHSGKKICRMHAGRLRDNGVFGVREIEVTRS